MTHQSGGGRRGRRGAGALLPGVRRTRDDALVSPDPRHGAPLDKAAVPRRLRRSLTAAGLDVSHHTQSGQARTLYPDFIFFHESEGEVVADIIDPHRPDAADTGPKWRGPADYAATHADKVRRVLAVIQNDDGQLISLDLRNPEVRERLEDAGSSRGAEISFRDCLQVRA